MLGRLLYPKPLQLTSLCNKIFSRKNYAHFHSSSRKIWQTTPKMLQLAKLKHSHTIIRSLSKINKRPATKELTRLIKVAESQKWKLAGAVLLLFVSSSVTVAVPFCVGKLIDIAMSSKADLKESLQSFCTVLIAVFIVGACANFGRVYFMNIASYNVVNSLRRRAYASILNQEAAFFDRSNTGELVNRLSADTTTVGMSITNNISDGLRYSFTLVAGSCLMVYTSPVLASLGLITVAPVAVIATVAGKYLKRNSQSVQDSLAEATQVAEERISNIRTVQAFAKFEEENNIYASRILNVLHFATKESVGRAVFFGMTGFSGNLIILSVLYYGGIMMNDDLITIGGLSSFLLYAAYVGISIGGLSTFYSELMRGLGASTRLWELIDRKPSISLQGGLTLPHFSGCVTFRDVSFAYPSRPDTPVLSRFDLSIPNGTVYALVGSSGCGKSTIASLLLRLYDCQNGSVMLDEEDVKTLNVQWLRQNIGYVSQDPVLFSFTVRENILYGATLNSDVRDSEIEDVLHKANALEFVKRFPKGLDTMVGERGVMLSGGQRQRIAIARALLKNPKILILDEATSALDAQSEHLVQKALDELMDGRTVITIAHRLSTVRKANTIAVLDSGRVIEEGAYDDLILKKGAFYRLVQLQSLKS